MQKKNSFDRKLSLHAALMLLTGILLCASKLLNAQAPIYQFQTLPVKGVNCFIEDAEGMRWFGSNFGLVRYDGLRIKTYVHNLNDSNTLCDNRIWCITEDKKNRLWIATQNGICVYDKNSDSFYRMPLLYDSLNRVLNEISNIKCAADGSVVWTARNSIFHSTFENGIFKSTAFKVNDKSFAMFRYYALELTGQYAWAITDNDKVLKYHLGNPASEIEISLQIPNGGASFTLEELKKDDDYFYFKTINSIYSVSLDSIYGNKIGLNELIKPFRKQDNLLTSFYFCKSNANELWLASGNEKIIHYGRTSGNRFIPIDTISAAQDNLFFLKNEAIFNISSDRGGSVYFATEKNIYALRTEGLLFQSSKKFEKLLRRLNNSYYIRNIGMLNDSIGWASTTDFEFVTINLTAPYQIVNWNHLKGMQVNDILSFKKNTYLCFTADGIFLVDKKKLLKTINSSFGFDGLHTSQGDIWGVAGRGLYRIWDESKFEKIAPANSFLKNARTRTLIQYDTNTLLVGTDLGAVIVTVDSINTSVSNIECTRNSYINNFARIDSTVFIATNLGLFSYNPTTTFCQQLIGNDSIIKSILVSENKTLFISIEGIGIGRYDANTKKLVLFDTKNGVLSNAFSNDGEKALMLPDSTFCYATDVGLNYFNPATINYSNNPAIPYVTELMVNTTRLLSNASDATSVRYKKAYLENEPLVFSFDQNDLHFTFSVVTHLPSNKYTFMYLLQGYDDAWKSSTALEAFYTDVSPRYNSILFPGRYTMLARAMNEEGQLYDMPTPVQIVIKTIWYRSIEFIGLLLLAAIIIAYYVVRYYSQLKLKQKIAEQEKLLAVERERNRISRDLHDDLGAGLSSIAMMTNMMKDLVENNDAHQHASDISSEANELVMRMREIIWSMSAKHDNVDSLVSYIQQYAEKYLRKNRMQLQMQIQGEVPHDYIDARVRENVFLVVKETLHNSVKYSGSKAINILVTSQPKMLKLLIDDMGKGFDMQEIGKFGNGLSNMKNRMEAIDGIYRITSARDAGTQTEIEISYSVSLKK